MDDQKIWLNKPQLAAWLIKAKEEYGVWGRGTGKTEGPIALRSIFLQNSMPRGATGMVAATYMQILTRTLPPLEKAWQRFGYKPGVHYWVGQYPPKNLNIPKAIYHPRSPQHCIFWWNGHVRHFMSLDRPGLANGKTVDAIDGDEAKFLNYQRYMDDIDPTNRGNREVFGHLAHHHAVTFYTDMPTFVSGKWILEKEKEQSPRELLTQIMNLQIEYNALEAELAHPRTTDPRRKFLRGKIRGYAAALNELRKGTVFYSEASSLDNIDVLGVEQFRQWKRSMRDEIFQSAILNKRVISVENGFYPLLNIDQHTYDAFDYTFVDGLQRLQGFVQDCRVDADIDRQKPLDIAMDYGGFNCMVVGQERDNEYRVVKEFWGKDDQGNYLRLKDLVARFVDYYRTYATKVVNFVYDHTAVGKDASRIMSYADEVSTLLDKAGWSVRRMYIGQQPKQDSRYRMWQLVLKEDNPQMKPVRFNKTNCEQLLVSIQGARTRMKEGRVDKDKRDEQNSLIPQETTTHFSDAIDTLYIGKFKHTMGYAMPSSSLIF